MFNLKLDIEDRLWAYFEKEKIFQLNDVLTKLVPIKERVESVVSNCKEISDNLHPISRLCHEIALKHGVQATIKVYEGDINKADKIIGCFAGDDYIYFHFQPRIQDQLHLSEISHIVEHEVGHYFFRTKVSPEEICSPNILNYFGISKEEIFRIQVLAYMLAHISEFNADRFAAFSSKDISGFVNAQQKLNDYELNRSPDPGKIKELYKAREINWKGKYIFTHPIMEDRAAALVCLERYLHDPDFDINKTPDVYNKILELLSYNEFMQEFGGYYKG